MKIICGLGNPGKQYEYTHHNMGFLAVDEIAGRLGVKINKLKFKALSGETILFGEKIVLVKPQTFMNNSGEALREVMNFYKAEPKDLFVIYDDIDLEAGALRVRASGSSGSHNGMKSVIYQLQYDNFPRCRIGIGKSEDIPLIGYVLSAMSESEAEVLMPAVSKAADAALVWAQYGIKAAMDFANVSEDTKKKNAQKKEAILKSKRLIIRPMSDSEIRKHIESSLDEAEKAGYSAALEKCIGYPDDRMKYVPWCIRLKDGGIEIGTAYFDDQGELKLSVLPEYAEEYSAEAEAVLNR